MTRPRDGVAFEDILTGLRAPAGIKVLGGKVYFIEQGTLTIKGERKFDRNEAKGTGYHRIERSYGSFRRSFTLPADVDAVLGLALASSPT